MSRYASVWEEIDTQPAVNGWVVRRVLPDLAHDCFLGMEHPAGTRFLELGLVGLVGDVPPGDPSTSGLDVSIVLRTKDRAVIKVALAQPTMSQQFFDVVQDLLRETEESPGDGVAARVVERLFAWRAFFGGASESLSTDRAAGLFAELTVLARELAPTIGPARSVQHWTGPDPGKQDFQFESGAIEVKSWRGKGNPRVRISSEVQLDTSAAGAVWLAVLEIDQRPAGPGDTLAGLIASVRDLTAGLPATQSLFENKLLSCGWRDELSNVRTERYTVLSTEFFEVADSFPRLIPSSLPSGVSDVTYRIDR